jgi:NAD(P)-dependent dehydrogenase (short-subunit alcohol dehydrogenase family)
MADTISYNGQTVIVTGAGRNIGRAHAIEFARRGASVVVDDWEGDLAKAVTDEITAAGGKAVASGDSVATDDGAKAIVDLAMNEFGSVEALVSNAGVLECNYFKELTDEQIDTSLNVHLRGAFRMAKLVWPIMADRGYGRLMFTSSNSGMMSNQGMAGYAAAKAGLYGLTKALAFEGADFGIKANAILPIAAGKSPWKPPVPDQQKYRELYLDKPIPWDDWRWAPSNIAALAAFLCSRECELSGEALSACHGRFARVFVGVADGWLAPDQGSISSEAIADHLGEIRDLSNHTVPMWMFEELRGVTDRIRAGG